MSISDIKDSFSRSRAQGIRDELGETRFRLFLTLVDMNAPNPVIARALGIELWYVTISKRLIAREQPHVIPELRSMILKSPLRLITKKSVEEEKMRA